MVKFEGFDTKSSQVEEISAKELKFGYWYVTHKEAIRKAVITSLLVFSVLTFGYAAFATIRFYFFRYDIQQDVLNRAAFDYVNIAGVHESNKIQNLQILSRDVFNLGAGKIDVVARVYNPNKQWALKSFKYQFAVAGELLEEEESFVMPGEEKYVLALNVEGRASGTPQLLINERKWQRVTLYEEWGQERLNFIVKEKRFTSPRQGEISGKLPVSEVSALITNATPYNYNEVEIQIGLSSGNRLLSITKLSLNNFASGTTKPLAARWSQSLAPVSAVEIIPTVNILDPKVYKDFEGEYAPAFIEFDDRGRPIRR